MPVIATVQLKGFFVCIASGFVFAVLYDVFCALKKCVPVLKKASAVFDIILWMAFTLFFFLTLQMCLEGEFYWFYLAGEIFGFVLYLFTLSRLVLPVLEKMLGVITSLFCTVYRVNLRVTRGILRIFSPLGRLFGKVVQITRKNMKKFVKKTLEITHRFGVLLYKV